VNFNNDYKLQTNCYNNKREARPAPFEAEGRSETAEQRGGGDNDFSLSSGKGTRKGNLTRARKRLFRQAKKAAFRWAAAPKKR
jgi:hypothetical protein